ncbi:hypothetical protein EDD86DRAFT_247696 [Gorgonomyces haynaldii]|nr:hypothetical protein EDD86DRAFT_247696 [Gorgonomyces haynaldii]
MTPEMIQYFTQLSENRNRRLVYMRKLQSKGYFDVDQIRQRHPELWQEYLGSESESVWKKPFDRQMGLLDRIYFNLDESEPYLRVEMYKKWKSSKKSDLEASELESEREDLEKSLDEGDKEQTVEEQQPEDSPPEAEGEETLEELTQELRRFGLLHN